MIKEVIHDPILLAMKSEKATFEDLQVKCFEYKN